MTPIAPLMTTFLHEHMPVEQGLSPHTCETYAHAFRLLFRVDRRVADGAAGIRLGERVGLCETSCSWRLLL